MTEALGELMGSMPDVEPKSHPGEMKVIDSHTAQD